MALNLANREVWCTVLCCGTLEPAAISRVMSTIFHFLLQP
jgi:hypothetical protein